ncbi:MAG: hypothetical protein AB7O38_05045 [Pirellulaceae bacterium]
MAGMWAESFRIQAGTVRYHDLGYLALESQQTDGEHSLFLEWDAGEWAECGVSSWGTVSFDRCRHPLEQGIAMGEFGEAMLMGSGDIHAETIRDGDSSPETRGYLRRVRGIAGVAYAAGMDRQVYRRQDHSRWVSIDHSMRPSADGVYGFEGLDGFAEDDIYAGGYGGEIWQYDGRRWTQRDSPTNAVLTNLVCGGDGWVYACGRVGLLLRGRGDEWSVVEHEATQDDFWGLAWFGNRLYLASYHRLFRLEDDTLVPVEFGEDMAQTRYHLAAADGVLWSIGAQDVMSFDGASWTRID